MANGVRPATAPAVARVFLDTVGRVTAKSLPPGVEMVQVLSVTLPLKVMVPSAALAASGAAASIRAAMRFILCIRFYLTLLKR